MGSLDILSAKKQFLQLVDSVSSRHLPSFAIWLDSKLAEYKVNGYIVADDTEAEKRSYPEWISKSLRENLSFCLPQARPSEESSQKGISAEGSEGTVSMNVDMPADPVETLELQSGEFDVPQKLSDQEASSSSCPENSDLIVKIEIPSDDEVKELESLPLNSDIGFQHMSVNQTLYMTDSLSSTHDQLSRNEQLSFSNFQSSSSVSFSPASHTSNLAPVSSIATSDASQPQHAVASSGSLSAPASSLQPTETDPLKPLHRHHCSICSKHFPFSSYLNRHMRSHSTEKLVKCPHCDATFKYENQCYNHQRKEHSNLPLVSVKSSLTLNARRVLSRKTYRCSVCLKEFPFSSYLNRHMLSHSRKKPVKSPECDDTFVKSSECDETFKDEKHCYYHQQVRHPNVTMVSVKTSSLEAKPLLRGKIHRCSVCSKDFPFSSCLNRHMRSHSRQNLVKCPYCNETFNNENQCYDHQTKKHPTVPIIKVSTLKNKQILRRKVHRCSVCSREFRFSSHLNSHMRSHSTQRFVKCPHCDVTFKYGKQCYDHQRKAHPTLPISGTKTFLTLKTKPIFRRKIHRCSMCSKEFPFRSYLVRHSASHSPFYTPSGREVHIRKGVAPPSKGQLQPLLSQVAKSTGRTYQCSICSKEFPFRSYLNRHMKMHSTGTHIKCPRCNMTFKHESSCYRHQRKKHRDLPIVKVKL